MPLFWGKGIAICNFSVESLLNSLVLKRLQIMMLRIPSGLVDEYVFFPF